ncbi:protein tyrosine phosphatase domain-containing protein 1 isoform X2 [Xenopus laevis]|uniref:Protein tyrosine phosphatase domain-containing protein 1 isoform X2 n=2 Tax=Xenopus laevis TaxID=8355 RepID=A0A1L8GZP7_XENLA|nr:protein tyrosine phosphatase domain-containing protein 1 isoform X2 [Xenopus laevis]OCT89323.1 hypothetical protein XELAEV_18017942mg [Xenopus laevis]
MRSSTKEPGPSYSHTRERLVKAIPPRVICSLTCGGRECRYEGPESWSEKQQAIRGLYSSWITEEILATSRPSTRLMKEHKITDQFHRYAIRSVISAQQPWEHPHCGDSLDPQSGFSYRPQDFMDAGITFYNFGLPDFGVVPVPRILDAVKVIAFALREGRVAIHCHAGLGRTGVLIACYLVYACRVSSADAIRFVRLRRPGSIQTASQVSRVHDFAMFLSSQWPVFPCIPPCISRFTLSQYMTCQRHLLHGQEARCFRHLPKPVVVTCRRLVQLAGGRRGCGGPWVQLEREAAHKLLHQVIIRVAREPSNMSEFQPACEDDESEKERAARRRRGMLKTQISYDTGILQLLLTGSTIVENGSSGMCHNDIVQTTFPSSDVKHSQNTQSSTGSYNTNGGDVAEQTPIITSQHTLCVAEALADVNEPDNEIIQKVQNLQSLLNEEGAWAAVSTESDPKVLSTLLWDWLHQLKEPVLTLEDVNCFCDGDWREHLKKLNRCQGETLCCLLHCVSKLPSLLPQMEELVILRLVRALTQLPTNAPKLPSNVISRLHTVVSEIRVQGMSAMGVRR